MKHIRLTPAPHPAAHQAGAVRGLGMQLAAILLTLVVTSPLPLQAHAADPVGARGDATSRPGHERDALRR
jgi:hypothetical protein